MYGLRKNSDYQGGKYVKCIFASNLYVDFPKYFE